MRIAPLVELMLSLFRGYALKHYNNFDFLRFFFAFSVLVAHSFDLSREPALKDIYKYWMSAETAVAGFFIISGFLIFRSYARSSSLRSYSKKRALRLLPAYSAVICLSLFLGALISNSSDFWSGGLTYFLANISFLNFLEPTLPGVFLSNPVPGVINGALWTLKIEILFYTMVPVLFWLCLRFGALRTIVAFYFLSFLWKLGILEATNFSWSENMARQLPGQLGFFLSGALFYYFFDFFKSYFHWIWIPAAFIYTFTPGLVGDFFSPISLAFVVIPLAYSQQFRVYNFGKYGDFSYGLYIVHYPVIQSLVHFGVFEKSPSMGFLLAALISLGLAILSWHLIEKRFLKSKPKDRVKTV